MLRRPSDNEKINMTTLFDLKQNELEKLSIKDYFKSLELAFDSTLSVDELTDFFIVQTHVETKPYLIRRRLTPDDTRFKQIELVYKDSNKVDAIVWEIKISLSNLTDIFGEPIIHNEPYNHSTGFTFKSNNPYIEIIMTRHPKWLTLVKGRNVFEYQNENNKKVELVNPEFSFIQFDLKNFERTKSTGYNSSLPKNSSGSIR